MRSELTKDKPTGKYKLTLYPTNGIDIVAGYGFTRAELYELFVQLRSEFSEVILEPYTECLSVTPCGECEEFVGCTMSNKGTKD